MKKSVSKSVSNTLVKVKTTTASPAATDTRLRGDINLKKKKEEIKENNIIFCLDRIPQWSKVRRWSRE